MLLVSVLPCQPACASNSNAGIVDAVLVWHAARWQAPFSPRPSCSTTGMLFYNSMLSLPMLLGAVALRGEPGRLGSYPLLWDPQFQLVVSGGACCFAHPGGMLAWGTRNRGRVPAVQAAAPKRSCGGLCAPLPACSCCWLRRWACPSTTPPLCARASTSHS